MASVRVCYPFPSRQCALQGKSMPDDLKAVSQRQAPREQGGNRATQARATCGVRGDAQTKAPSPTKAQPRVTANRDRPPSPCAAARPKARSWVYGTLRPPLQQIALISGVTSISVKDKSCSAKWCIQLGAFKLHHLPHQTLQVFTWFFCMVLGPSTS